MDDNDAKTMWVSYIYRIFVEFRDAVWPTKVKFSGHLRRKDLPPQCLRIICFYEKNLGPNLKEPECLNARTSVITLGIILINMVKVFATLVF